MKKTETYDMAVYPEDLIQQAVNVYAGVCPVRYRISGQQVVCEFEADAENIDLIILEFGNFLIELMQ
jgi:hypothetical protein